MPDWLLSSITAAVASGLINYGANRVNFAWLRRDIDNAHKRIDDITIERRRSPRKNPNAEFS